MCRRYALHDEASWAFFACLSFFLVSKSASRRPDIDLSAPYTGALSPREGPADASKS
ncbi:hypothetical protein CCM_07017 [Cordyceps militaris CM01]|uniref:Uncharacterized protein n=1 Tax=Cordyceps militaris (strain CM01) TaxID=983644 RepID=G3JLM3_CORMM|nr:uncharacterized protein CCM_07017 [Cordyceps militaris CM01]EGX90597.1 hypothetical protein CCM_07017 [Cordyceps militaris CM01]